MTMDEIDIKILKILDKDARVPFNKIGKMLGISKDSVKRRFERIKKRNPNLKCSVKLNVSKLGFKAIIGFCLKSSNNSDNNKIRNILLNCPRLMEVTETVGDFDFYFDVFTEDYSDLYEIYEYLKQIKEIESLNVFFWNLNSEESIHIKGNRFISSVK